MPGPWSLHSGGTRPMSSGRMVLADALEALCLDHDFVKPAEIAAAFTADPDTREAERDRALVRKSIATLARLFIDGVLPTFTRPLGGGEVVKLPAGHWEIDDHEPRFATNLIDPARWWDPSATGTHWILVDATAFDMWMYENSADAFLWKDRVPPAAATDASAGGLALGAGAVADGGVAAASGEAGHFLRIDEVLARTGLSRSTLYERIKASAFPRQRANGGRIVMWLESEVTAWQAAQIANRPDADPGRITPPPGGGGPRAAGRRAGHPRAAGPPTA